MKVHTHTFIGKPQLSKTDEFLEKFQTGFDPPPYIFLATNVSNLIQNYGLCSCMFSFFAHSCHISCFWQHKFHILKKNFWKFFYFRELPLINSQKVLFIPTVHGVATSLKLVVGWCGTHGWMDWLWFVGGNSEHSLKLVHLLLLIFLSQIVGFCNCDCSDNFANIWI